MNKISQGYYMRCLMALQAVIRCESHNAIMRKTIRIGGVGYEEKLEAECKIQDAEHKLALLEIRGRV